jgi:hypothetical protein
MAEKEKGFVVKDRRMFSQDGPPAADEPPAAEERPEPKSASASDAPPRQTETPLPQINFPTFVASLNASALVHRPCRMEMRATPGKRSGQSALQ